MPVLSRCSPIHAIVAFSLAVVACSSEETAPDAGPSTTPTDCAPRCVSKAQLCGAPANRAAEACASLCPRVTSASQLTCLEASSCSQLTTVFENTGTVCGIN